MKAKSARTVLIAALTLYLLWIAALTGMAVVSASRPAAAKFDPSTAPTKASPDVETNE